MKLIIAGSRDLTKRDLWNALKIHNFTGPGLEHIAEVVSGHASSGIDVFGEMYAASKGLPIKHFPADWEKYGRKAGPIRNRQMARYADGLLAVWDGKSPGTQNMILEAHRFDLQVWVHVPHRFVTRGG